MAIRNRFVFLVLCIVGAVYATRTARADELDVTTFEHLDVVETVEGSIWKGVVTEQLPNVHYKIATSDGSLHVIRASDVLKITKQRNPRYGKSSAIAAESPELVDSVSPPPAQTSGAFRIDPELAVLLPAGDMIDLGPTTLDYRTSIAPGIRLGYEHRAASFSIAAGGLVRFASWRLPEQIASFGSHWTLETHGFVHAAVRTHRASPYVGLSVGLDSNHTYNAMSDFASTEIAFGMNLQAGVAIDVTPSASIDLGLDYHPGTDKIETGVDASVSYFALRLGAAIRL